VGSGIKMDRILAMDCETSGLNFSAAFSNSKDTTITGYQPVSWGFIATDLTYKPIAELYVEIKWNGISKWDSKAESVHGLSKKYLEQNGVDEEEAVAMIVEFLMEHFDLTKPIYCLGHNVASFDLVVLKDMLARYDVPGIRFGHRHFDTFSLSMGTVKELDSNTLFKRVGLPTRGDHNALEDARHALETYRRISKIWTTMLEQSSKNSKKK